MPINDFNFIDTCFNSHLENICYFGFFDLLLGTTFLVFNFYGFFKMTHFFKKIKFENMLVLLSLVQLIFFLIAMIFLIRIFIYLFIFMQIFILFLMNHKFINLSKGFLNIKYAWINKAIIIINIVYLLALIVLYSLSLDYNYIFCSYYCLELIASITLTIYCCKFLNIIKKKLNDKKRAKIKLSDNPESEKKSFAERNISVIKNNNMLIYNFVSNTENELFYIFKKKQLTILYLANIICTILESGCQVSLIFIESSEISQLLIYIYFFISLWHNIIIFLSFYWIIRGQYMRSINLLDIYKDDIDENGLIDDNFIEEEVINIENQRKLTSEEKKSKTDSSNPGTDLDEDFEALE